MKRVYRQNLLERTETDLGDDARVLFVLPNGAEVVCAHAGRQESEGTLAIRVRNGSVRVRPVASNVVCIEVTDATNVRPGTEASSADLPRTEDYDGSGVPGYRPR
jgi:hypothetical protein